MAKTISILSGHPRDESSARPTAGAVAAQRAADMAEELAQVRFTSAQLMDELSAATAECTRLEDRLEERGAEIARLQDALERARSGLTEKEALLHQRELAETGLRAQLGAAQDARDEAKRALTTAQQSLQAAIARPPSVIERLIGGPQSPPAPAAQTAAGYELVVVERDGNDRMRRMVVKPTGGG